MHVIQISVILWTLKNYLVNIYGLDNMCNMEIITSQSILVKNMFENTTSIVELHKELTIMKPAFQEINEIIT